MISFIFHFFSFFTRILGNKVETLDFDPPFYHQMVEVVLFLRKLGTRMTIHDPFTFVQFSSSSTVANVELHY